jgi:hypothetical protein
MSLKHSLMLMCNASHNHIRKRLERNFNGFIASEIKLYKENKTK